MRELQTISAEPRQRTGTGGARAARRAGRIPGILYGGGGEPVAIHLDPMEIAKAYHAGNFTSQLVSVALDGQKLLALPREVQTHPVRDHVIHVDFLKVDEHTRIDVDVPLRFINHDKSPGLKRGGVLNVVRHEVELNCPAVGIPPFIEADLDGLDIGDAIKISAITLPADVSPVITGRDFTLATVAAPSQLITEEEEKAAAEAAAAAAAAVEGAEAPAEGAEAAEGEGESSGGDDERRR